MKGGNERNGRNQAMSKNLGQGIEGLQEMFHFYVSFSCKYLTGVSVCF